LDGITYLLELLRAPGGDFGPAQGILGLCLLAFQVRRIRLPISNLPARTERAREHGSDDGQA
jgi:hypothetical protein